MKTLKFSSSVTFHLFTIIALGCLIYSNTLTVAFQFDDKLNIVNNPLIRDIKNLWPPEGPRWFGLLTFSLNYLAGGFNPIGYHLVNTGIHIFTAISVYLFVRFIFRTPCFSVQRDSTCPDAWLAFTCAIIFVAHPIQTQAVTYIVQRFSSLAALFFMLSLDCYILARLVSIKRISSSTACRHWPNVAMIALYAAAALSALISFKTKENAYTLPLVVLLCEILFFNSLTGLTTTIRQRLRMVVPLSVLSLFFFIYILINHDIPGLFEKLKATNEISRHDYLITQFRVITTYIRLLFIPVNQTIDHQYQIYRTVYEPAVFFSLLAIIFLLLLALYLFRISRGANPYLRLVSFGIIWFFVTLSVESSIIPLADVMFEHRLYLPSIGAILAAVSAVAYALQRQEARICRAGKTAAGILFVVTIVLSYATYERNKVWRNELTLWTDAIAKTPLNPRAYNMVGGYYQANFRIYDAIPYFKKALEVDSTYAGARSNLGIAYVMTGRIDDGLRELMLTAQTNHFDAIDTGILFYNIGKAFNLKGMPDRALEYLNTAIRYNPNEADVYFLLGTIYRRKNLVAQSSMYHQKAHELAPGKY